MWLGDTRPWGGGGQSFWGPVLPSWSIVVVCRDLSHAAMGRIVLWDRDPCEQIGRHDWKHYLSAPFGSGRSFLGQSSIFLGAVQPCHMIQWDALHHGKGPPPVLNRQTRVKTLPSCILQRRAVMIEAIHEEATLFANSNQSLIVFKVKNYYFNLLLSACIIMTSSRFPQTWLLYLLNHNNTMNIYHLRSS